MGMNCRGQAYVSLSSRRVFGPEKYNFLIRFLQFAGCFSYKRTQCVPNLGKLKRFTLSKLPKIEFLVIKFVHVK